MGDKAKNFTNVYVKNFGEELDDDKLKELFEPFGKIISAKVGLLLFFFNFIKSSSRFPLVFQTKYTCVVEREQITIYEYIYIVKPFLYKTKSQKR